MTEIKLTKRYPNSRTEDITDAYMRGWNDALDAVQNGKFHIAEQTEPRVIPTTEADWEEVSKLINERLEKKWTKEKCQGCKYNEYPYDESTCFVRVCINGNKYEPTTEDCSMVETMSCQECNWWNPIKRACSIADVSECDYQPITVISLSEDEYEKQTDCPWK